MKNTIILGIEDIFKGYDTLGIKDVSHFSHTPNNYDAYTNSHRWFKKFTVMKEGSLMASPNACTSTKYKD